MSPHATYALLLSAFLAVLPALGCGGSSSRLAPFHARPDSTQGGQLEGPFSGQVKDGASGDPVPGALVYATWNYQRGAGIAQPAGFQEAMVSTDANGRYKVVRPTTNIPKGRLAGFRLVVYKKGYVAYRSDRRFSDFGPRFDFAQRHNPVRLERWNSEHSHARHLRYVGGGSALSALTAWERGDAAAELASAHQGGARTLASPFMNNILDDTIIAAQLLGEAEIKKITGFEGSFESGHLNDEADTPTYSSQHFKALSQPEAFDVAIRLWRTGRKDEEKGALAANARFKELAATLPGVTERSDMADRSLLALEGEIQGYAFMDKRRSIVVLITCGKGQCKSKNELIAIANKIFQNLQAVMPLAKVSP